MATNPLYKNNDSPSNSTQPTKAVNRQGVNVHRTHNTFDMSYFHFKTQKFGQYEPFFVMEAVPGDVIPFSNSHNVRALPMSSPFLSSLKLNKDYFLIPNQAIQPNTWEYIFRNPTQGDDIPEDAHNVFPIFSNGSSILSSFLSLIRNYSEDSSNSLVLWSLLSAELFLSSGSLLYQLGCKFNIQFIDSDGSYFSFDSLFDKFVNSISYLEIELEDGRVFNSDDIGNYAVISLLRFYGSRAFINEIYVEGFTSYDYHLIISNVDSINLDRLIAYQLSCAQFYVNPNVDFIYNAQLYRDNLYSLWVKAFSDEDGVTGTSQILTFPYNGMIIPYDYCSRAYYQRVFNYIVEGLNDFTDLEFSLVFDYLNAIFGLRESLRFGDYFTDSRTQPLAVGENNIPVVDGSINVIDTSRSIIYQRFRNAVVKLGNNFGDYLRGIFGTEPSPDYHIPKFIIHQDFDVSGFEVSNTTSESQGSIVTNLNTQDDTYVFEVTVDMPCVIIGISYFSIPRAYMQTKDRPFFHKNRFDMFNPMLQYVGDQPVYNYERTSQTSEDIFGYQSRYNEYKQRYSVVSGGFTSVLPAWTFVADSLFDPVVSFDVISNQGPDFIRAHDYEFNRFLSRIPGYSLGTGFHFIVVYNNKCVANRPMEVNPNTL